MRRSLAEAVQISEGRWNTDDADATDSHGFFRLDVYSNSDFSNYDDAGPFSNAIETARARPGHSVRRDAGSVLRVCRRQRNRGGPYYSDLWRRQTGSG